MNNNNVSKHEIKKLHLEGIVLFAINNIPDADPNTLKHFLELANTGGTFGTISHDRIIRKMNQVLKYVPRACLNSLLILMDLLEIEPPNQLALGDAQSQRIQSGNGNGNGEPMTLVIEASKAVVLDDNGFYSR